MMIPLESLPGLQLAVVKMAGFLAGVVVVTTMLGTLFLRFPKRVSAGEWGLRGGLEGEAAADDPLAPFPFLLSFWGRGGRFGSLGLFEVPGLTFEDFSFFFEFEEHPILNRYRSYRTHRKWSVDTSILSSPTSLNTIPSYEIGELRRFLNLIPYLPLQRYPANGETCSRSLAA
jgi:hypothetical protein